MIGGVDVWLCSRVVPAVGVGVGSSGDVGSEEGPEIAAFPAGFFLAAATGIVASCEVVVIVVTRLTNKRRSRLYSVAEEQKGGVVVVYTGSDLYIFADLVYGVADYSTRKIDQYKREGYI